MAPSEGIVKFRCDYTPAPALPATELRELNAWRKLLVLTQLIGQDPNRYGGYGFGNISCRLNSEEARECERAFVITGTQTGGIADLTVEHYVVVKACYPDENYLIAEGPVGPSSESLTHGTIYALDSSIRWVMHAHSPHIWRHAQALSIPVTGPVPYGSPEMAAEVRRLYKESDLKETRIFAMAGHEDGIVTFGRTAEEAGFVLLGYLVRAMQL
ncbi:MAG: class II aldolase/adducin family protein [Caldilineaceae bacterium]|nr:class II aldolase/adducin family protein [Caldilineaceae bacterium]